MIEKMPTAFILHSVNAYAVAKALAITKPIPYSASGVWEETVQNVADALLLPHNSLSRNGFLRIAGVELDNTLPGGKI